MLGLRVVVSSRWNGLTDSETMASESRLGIQTLPRVSRL